MKCICGSANFVDFNPEYLRCSTCETLVLKAMPGPEISEIKSDESHYYGRSYWSHDNQIQTSTGVLEVRAESDLTERVLHWTQAILKYKLPSQKKQKVLEVGCGSGGLLFLLKELGFSVEGLEMSAKVVDFAKNHFHLDIKLGSFETQQYEDQSFDMIILMDVIEHLLDPKKALDICRRILKPDGILVIQCPRYIEGTTYSELQKSKDRFLEMLLPKEHLHLLSRKSILALLEKTGFTSTHFQRALFPYDMFLVTSPAQLQPKRAKEIKADLHANNSGKLFEALACLSEKNRNLESLLRESEQDRNNRLSVINNLKSQLDLLRERTGNEQIKKIRNFAKKVKQKIKFTLKSKLRTLKDYRTSSVYAKKISCPSITGTQEPFLISGTESAALLPISQNENYYLTYGQALLGVLTSDLLLTDSLEGKNWILQKFGVDPNRIHVHRPGPRFECNYEQLAHFDEAVNEHLLALGDFDKLGLQTTLLAAIGHMNASQGLGHGSVFLLGKDGEQRSYIQDLIDRMGLTSKVRILISRDQGQNDALFSRSKKILWCSRISPTIENWEQVLSFHADIAAPSSITIPKSVQSKIQLLDFRNPMNLPPFIDDKQPIPIAESEIKGVEELIPGGQKSVSSFRLETDIGLALINTNGVVDQIGIIAANPGASIRQFEVVIERTDIDQTTEIIIVVKKSRSSEMEQFNSKNLRRFRIRINLPPEGGGLMLSENSGQKFRINSIYLVSDSKNRLLFQRG